MAGAVAADRRGLEIRPQIYTDHTDRKLSEFSAVHPRQLLILICVYLCESVAGSLCVNLPA